MGRLRGFLWLFVGLIVAIMAGFVAYITLSRAGVQQSGGLISAPEVGVVVAARALEVGAVLDEEDVELRAIPVNAIPEGALRSTEDAVGLLTLVELYPAEVLLAQRLVDPNVVSGDGRIAVVVAEDEVLMAFPTEDLMSKIALLKPGDQVDMLFSLDIPYTDFSQISGAAGAARSSPQEKEEQSTFTVLENVTVAAIVGSETTTGGTGGAADALLLTVSPQDALVLKYVMDAEGIVDILLRSPGSDQPFESEPVDIDYIIDRYQISIGRGR